MNKRMDPEEASTSGDEQSSDESGVWPVVHGKDYSAPSVFRPEALLREARRPDICVLDPDGDVVHYLKRTGSGRRHDGWACYHTELLAFDLEGVGQVGVVGCAVGSSFAVLVVWVYTVIRLAHLAVYLRGGNAAKGGSIRTILYVAGALITVVLIVVTGAATIY